MTTLVFETLRGHRDEITSIKVDTFCEETGVHGSLFSFTGTPEVFREEMKKMRKKLLSDWTIKPETEVSDFEARVLQTWLTSPERKSGDKLTEEEFEVDLNSNLR